MSGIGLILYFLAFALVFYFTLVKPQKKKTKELTTMRDSISVGDEIVTIGGIIGKVKLISNDDITIEIAENTDIVIKKWAIGSVVDFDAKELVD